MTPESAADTATLAAATTESNVQFDRIGQIAITVRDLPRARNFYQHTLGMKFLFDAGSMSFFQCGDVRFVVGLSEEPVSIGGTILYFKVEDILLTHARLEEQGVRFLQAPHLVAKMPDHDLWMAFLKDPDENVLGVMSEIPRA
jgi:methylmalonyl-CoA/ethylmalonyl-CoA epimerase